MSAFKKIPKKLVYTYEPKDHWMSHDSALHGAAHMARVFMLQELICNQLEAEGTKVNRHATRWAATVHDVGRVDDGLDPEHGKRSAEWMKQNKPKTLSPKTLDTATYIVHWHVPHDHEAPVMTTELKVLKDADGLDRVRLGDLDESFLRTKPAKQLVEIAQKLHDASIPPKQDDESFDSVINAAITLGIVSAK